MHQKNNIGRTRSVYKRLFFLKQTKNVENNNFAFVNNIVAESLQNSIKFSRTRVFLYSLT